MTNSSNRRSFLPGWAAPTVAVALSLLLASVALASSTVVKDTAHLQLRKASNNTLTETGKAAGTLPGSVTVTLKINGRTASSTFKITARGGSLWGRGSGSLKLGKGGYESFGGTLTVSGGSGRFTHARGNGGIYGSLNRANDAMTVQVTGKLHT